MQRKNIITLSLIASFSTFIILSCTDTGITDVVFPEKNISYAEYVQPLFNLRCNNSKCHADDSAAGGVILTSWDQVTSDPLMVFPGLPDNSKLVWVIEGKPGFSPMPPLRTSPLNNNQIQGIRTWIKEGARNN